MVVGELVDTMQQSRFERRCLPVRRQIIDVKMSLSKKKKKKNQTFKKSNFIANRIILFGFYS